MVNTEELIQGSPLSSEQKSHLLEQLKLNGPTKEFFDSFQAMLNDAKEALVAEDRKEDAELGDKVNAELDAAEAEYEAQMAKAESELEQATQQFQKDLDAADAEDARNTIAQS